MATALTSKRKPMAAKDDGTLETRRRITLAWPSVLSTILHEGRGRIGGKARSLTRDLFSLEEPWQSRFLELIANLATNWTWDGQRPTREDVTAWLSTDADLYREVKLLLEAWQRPRR
jgi:hypothetical protein